MNNILRGAICLTLWFVGSIMWLSVFGLTDKLSIKLLVLGAWVFSFKMVVWGFELINMDTKSQKSEVKK